MLILFIRQTGQCITMGTSCWQPKCSMWAGGISVLRTVLQQIATQAQPTSGMLYDLSLQHHADAMSGAQGSES